MDALRTNIELAFRDRRHFAHATLIALMALTLLLQLVGLHGWIRELMALVVITFLPGAAVLSLLPGLNPLMRFGVCAAFSLTITTFAAWLLVELSIFHPGLLIWTILPASALLLAWRDFSEAGSAWQHRRSGPGPRGKSDRRRERERKQRIKAMSPAETLALTRERVASQAALAWRTIRDTPANRWAVAALAVGLSSWLIAVLQVDVAKMGDFGLTSVLPIGWPIGFSLVIIATALYAASERPNGWIMVSLVGGIIVLIYATAPLVYDAPHLPWVYKHVGVVNLLLDHGHALKNVDIYNRWPAFFALGGVFTRYSGARGPISYAGWAELYFIALQTSLVGSIMWNETKRVAPTGLAALLFVLINWIGQAYFSPQALAFTLLLAFLSIAFSQLYDTGNGLGRLIQSLTSFVVRRKQLWEAHAEEPTQWSPRTAITAALALDAGIAISHQLTPYVLLIQIGVLTTCGFLKPRWLFALCVGITLAYLLPNLGWVNHNYGLFSSLDPFNNAKVADTTKYTCSSACEVVSRISTLASAFSWLTGIAAILIIARRRPTFRLPLYGLAMFGSFVMIFGQSYGGEAALRVVMFSAPFAAILIAAAISTFGNAARPLLAVLVTILLSVSFIYAYFGNEEFYYVTRQSVRASEYLYSHAPPGSVVLVTAENFPGLLAGNYNEFYASEYTGSGGLLDDTRLRDQPLGAPQVKYVIQDIEATAPNGFVVFSTQMDRYALKKGLTRAGQLDSLRRAMIASGRFEIWHQDGGTVIYRLIPAGRKPVRG